MPRAAVVVLAGGSGTRVGAGLNKVYLPLAGRRVVSWSLQSAAQVPDVVALVLVIRPDDIALAQRALAADVPGLDVRVVVGGATRHGSEDAGLAHLAPDVQSGRIDVIVLHDGARPLAGASLFRSVLEVADAVGGAVPAVPAPDVVRVEDDGQPVVDRPGGPLRLARVQTPQGFRARGLLAAYAAAHEHGYEGTDTASSVEAFSALAVRTVPGSPLNLKVTYPHDLAVAERLLTAHRDRFS